MGCHWWRYSPISIGGIGSLNRLVSGDHVLRLGRGTASYCPTLEAATGARTYYLRKFWRIVLPSTSEGFCSGWCGTSYCHDMNNILLLRRVWGRIGFGFGASDTWLVLDDVENFIDWEPQQSEVLFHFEDLK